MTTKTTTTKTTRPNLETRLNDRRNDAINLLDQIRNHVRIVLRGRAGFIEQMIGESKNGKAE